MCDFFAKPFRNRTNTASNVFHTVVLRPFPYCGRRIELSFSTISGLVFLVSTLLSPSCLSFITSLQLSFDLPIFRCPLNLSARFSLGLLHRPQVLFHMSDHLSLASLIFSLVFATPSLTLITSALIAMRCVGGKPVTYRKRTNTKSSGSLKM